jgi:hypothetical protein
LVGPTSQRPKSMCTDWDQAQLNLIDWVDRRPNNHYIGFDLAQPYEFNLSLAYTTWSQPWTSDLVVASTKCELSHVLHAILIMN